MSTICFYAQFIASKFGVNGLTVTWDVEQITRSDGTRVALVTGGATTITVGRRGLYGYRLTSADLLLYDYIATAITATTTVDQQEIAAIGMVIPDESVSTRSTGVDAALAVRTELAVELAHLDADISSISGLTAQETRDAMKLAPTAGAPAAGSVDAHLDTLIASTAAIQAVTDLIDTSAVTVTTSNDAGLLTVYRGVTFAATVSGLAISASWTKVYLTVKTDLDLADTAATIQVVETNPGAGTDGLLYLNGAAPVNPITYADASLTVDQGAGTVAIALSDNLTAQLARGARLHWDLKQIVSSTSSGLLASGTMDIELTPTRTI